MCNDALGVLRACYAQVAVEVKNASTRGVNDVAYVHLDDCQCVGATEKSLFSVPGDVHHGGRRVRADGEGCISMRWGHNIVPQCAVLSSQIGSTSQPEKTSLKDTRFRACVHACTADLLACCDGRRVD